MKSFKDFLGPEATKKQDSAEIARQKKYLDDKAKEYREHGARDGGQGAAAAKAITYELARKNIKEDDESINEDLRKWFKQKWVRMDTKGNIKGDCAREPGEGKPKCLPQARAHALGKEGRASAAQRKRREDPNPERRGAPINVRTESAAAAIAAATAIAKKKSGNYDSKGFRKTPYKNPDSPMRKSNAERKRELSEEPRIPRKPGQPANSKKHSDLYTDENPIGTITGLKFATVQDAKASIKKIKDSDRSHAHKIQAAVSMEQRARVAGKSSEAAVYRAYINSVKKTNEELEMEGWSQKYKSSINCSHPKGFSQKAHCAGKKKHNESVEIEMTCPDCGMCQTHGDHNRNTLDEACWTGYTAKGLKKKGNHMVPNCVPEEVVKEEGEGGGVPTNNVGGGNIAGSGGKGGEPGVSRKRNPLMSFFKRKQPKM